MTNDLAIRILTGDVLGTTEQTHEAVAMAVKALSALPSAQPKQQWISCSERLPVKKTEVIYSLDNHYVSTGYMTDRDYNGDEMELHWEDMESGALIYPEAWMPLPEPYKGSE